MVTSQLAGVEQLAKLVANEILLPNYAKVAVDEKSDGSWLTIADTLAHQKLIAELVKIEDVAVLSEEMTESEQQAIIDHPAKSYWCIDPLDGTSNFSQGIPYWCISIALIQNGNIMLGVVYDPNRNECFSATFNTPSLLNGKEIKNNSVVEELDVTMGLIDFKRLSSSKAVKIVMDPPYRSQRSFGASALDYCWIASNRCQLYLHGHQKLWDYAAGVLILQNSGGYSQTFEGCDLFNNDLSIKNVIAATDSNLMKKWKEYFLTL